MGFGIEDSNEKPIPIAIGTKKQNDNLANFHNA